MYLSDVTCTNCHAAGPDLQTESTAVCRHCGTLNTVSGVICPHCEFINPPDAEVCQDCHQSLVRRCPNCNTLNWAGAERCIRCQGPLDTVAALSARYRTDTAARLRAQQHDAASLKAKEASDSERRMAALKAIEEQRQRGLDDAIRARERQQRLLVAAVIVLGVIVVVGTIIGLSLLAAH